MARLVKFFCAMAMLTGLVSHTEGRNEPVKWIPLTDPALEIRGLPWARENAPELWRLPGSVRTTVPKAVWGRAVAPDGGRIRFTSGTSQVQLRARLRAPAAKACYLDAYVNGDYAGSARVTETNLAELTLFAGRGQSSKDVTVYLSNNFEVQVLALGVDAEADLHPPPAFALNRPLVGYGSSVLQGTGAAHPSKTYLAATARQLNLDFVNLGFGGAGRAETNVVALVNQIDACAYLFDLGKSYGAQGNEPFGRMLDAIRAAHPKVPIICVTPIYSTTEPKDADFRDRSEKLRAMMRQEAVTRAQAGDRQMYVVEGLELFGERDQDAFADALHPNDEGNERMARRLAPILERILLPGSAKPEGVSSK